MDFGVEQYHCGCTGGGIDRVCIQYRDGWRASEV